MLKVFEYLEYICLFTILIIAIVQDIKENKIKNVLNVTGIVLGLLFALVVPDRTFVDALLGFVLLQVLGIVLWKVNAFRAGDAKLLCVTGTFLGWKMGLNVLLVSLVCGAIIGIPFVIKRLKKKEKGLTKYPFSISILLGTIIGVFGGYLWELLPVF